MFINLGMGQAKRREANFVETGVKKYHNVTKFIDLLIKHHKKAKYRYFIVKELKSTELTYIEQLTRMVGIKYSFGIWFYIIGNSYWHYVQTRLLRVMLKLYRN